MKKKETISRKLVQTVVFQDKNECSKKTTEAAKNDELVWKENWTREDDCSNPQMQQKRRRIGEKQIKRAEATPPRICKATRSSKHV